MNKIYSIHKGKSFFSIVPDLGALGLSLKLPVNGEMKELFYLPDDFWQQDVKEWLGGFPFCFPICGRLKEGDLPLHGFAPYMPYEVVDAQEDQITLQLKDNEETRKVYPYSFCLTLMFKISEDSFSAHFQCENLGDEPMPYYAGFHPYFLTPVEHKDKIKVDFDPLKRLQYNDALTDVVGELPVTQFPQVISNPELNEQLNLLNSPVHARLVFPQDYAIDVSFIDHQQLFCYIQMYTQQQTAFFCVEPWMNQPNAYNKNDIVRKLNAGDVDKAEITIRIKN